MINFCKLPKDISTSNYLKEKTLKWCRVQHFGISYYVPITKGCKKLLKLKVRKNKLEFPTYKLEGLLEDYLRDIIDAVYLQIRDTIGAEIKRDLQGQINEGLEKLFDKKLDLEIGKKFQKKLPYLGG